MKNNVQAPLSPTAWRRHPSLHLFPGQFSGSRNFSSTSHTSAPTRGDPRVLNMAAGSKWAAVATTRRRNAPGGPVVSAPGRCPRKRSSPGSASSFSTDLFHLRWESTLFSRAAGSGKAVRGQTSRQKKKKKKKKKAASTCVPAPVSTRPLGASTRSSTDGTRLGHFRQIPP